MNATLSQKQNILSTSFKRIIWVLPLTIYTQQTPDLTKAVSPSHLEIDFLIGSGAAFNILSTDTWNKNKEYHKLSLKPSTFVLSAAIFSKLQSNGTVKFILYPDVTKKRTLRNTFFTLTFHVSNTKDNILGTIFL